MDEYQRQMQAMMKPKAPSAPAPPAYVAPPAPAAPPAYVAPPAPAAPQSAEFINPNAIQETDGTAGMGWAAKVKYNPDEDVFPVFPPHYKTFDQIWAEFQADKRAGKF